MFLKNENVQRLGRQLTCSTHTFTKTKNNQFCKCKCVSLALASGAKFVIYLAVQNRLKTYVIENVSSVGMICSKLHDTNTISLPFNIHVRTIILKISKSKFKKSINHKNISVIIALQKSKYKSSSRKKN